MLEQFQNGDTLFAVWIAALKSGKFEKATGTLRVGETNCCCVFGVLCVASGLPVSTASIPALAEFLDITVDGCFVEPLVVIGNLVPRREILIRSLMYLNDGTGLSLPEIGERIEQNHRARNFRPYAYGM